MIAVKKTGEKFSLNHPPSRSWRRCSQVSPTLFLIVVVVVELVSSTSAVKMTAKGGLGAYVAPPTRQHNINKDHSRRSGTCLFPEMFSGRNRHKLFVSQDGENSSVATSSIPSSSSPPTPSSTTTMTAVKHRYGIAGPAAVDMNNYNISPDRAIMEWVANLTPQTSMMDSGVYLGAKSSKELFVDLLHFEVPRNTKKGGLGIELLEIAGGREDGLGITVVSGLVSGGNAEGCGITAGDSIVKLAVRKVTNTDGDGTHQQQEEQGLGDQSAVLTEVEEQTSVSTECLDYDATVDAITSLPPPKSDDENIILTVKRIRRRPKVTVKLQYPPSQNEPDTTLELFAGENLRRAMLARGVKLNDPLAKRFDSGGSGDCGAEGTCATCAVSVTNGMDLLNPRKQREGQLVQNNARWRLACKAVVGYGMKEGEMTVRVNPRQWD